MLGFSKNLTQNITSVFMKIVDQLLQPVWDFISKYATRLWSFVISAKFIVIVAVVLVFGLIHFGYLVYSFEFQGIAIRLQDFITLVLSVVLGALPFLVLGVGISSLVATFIDEKMLLKLIPRNRFGAHVMVSLLGMLMPVCECGNIPLARRLMLKGFTASQAVTFLLAAPIINVVTIWSTFTAFNTEPIVVISRVVWAFIIANFIGILLSYKPDQSELLSAQLVMEMRSRPVVKVGRFEMFMDTFQAEFWSVFKMLMLGAVVAAGIQMVIPRDTLIGLASSPVLSIVVMISLALIIAMCSSVDAFFALSLSSIFNTGAIVSFLIFGPMIDVKILSMLRGSFSTRTLVIITAFVTMGSMIAGLLVNLIL